MASGSAKTNRRNNVTIKAVQWVERQYRNAVASGLRYYMNEPECARTRRYRVSVLTVFHDTVRCQLILNVVVADPEFPARSAALTTIVYR